MAVRGAQHCYVLSDVVQPDDTVHPKSLDCRLALELHTNFHKERSSSLEVADNNENVVQPAEATYPKCRVGWLVMSVRRGAVCSWTGPLRSACSTIDFREL